MLRLLHAVERMLNSRMKGLCKSLILTNGVDGFSSPVVFAISTRSVSREHCSFMSKPTQDTPWSSIGEHYAQILLLFQLYRVDVFQTKKLSKKLVDDLEFGGSFVFYVWIAHLRGDILLLTKNNGDIILKLSSLSALTCMYLNYLCAKCRSSCKSLIYI
jgi:hypothetical protein